MTETNTPGGIRGAILRIVVEEGNAKPEHVDELNRYDQAWKDAGLKKGDWAVIIDDKPYPIGSEEYRNACHELMNQFKPS